MFPFCQGLLSSWASPHPCVTTPKPLTLKFQALFPFHIFQSFFACMYMMCHDVCEYVCLCVNTATHEPQHTCGVRRQPGNEPSPSTLFLCFIYLFLIYLFIAESGESGEKDCVHLCTCMHAMVYACRTEDSFVEWVLFCHVS